MREPADFHWAEQMQARGRDIGRVVGAYVAGLRSQGVSEAEAWASGQKLELRLWQERVFEPAAAYEEVERLLSDLRSGITKGNPPVDA